MIDLSIKDYFCWRYPEDLKVLWKQSGLGIIRGSFQDSKSEGGYSYMYGITQLDRAGLPNTDDGVRLTESQIRGLADAIAGLVADGSIKAGCNVSEHEAGIQARKEFLQEYEDKNRRAYSGR